MHIGNIGSNGPNLVMNLPSRGLLPMVERVIHKVIVKPAINRKRRSPRRRASQRRRREKKRRKMRARPKLRLRIGVMGMRMGRMKMRERGGAILERRERVEKVMENRTLSL